ncbi:aldehyde dehydrogenase family protein [Erythrobacter sp. SN021]|uniref:aldehyde dehydrogenase family protein n=1 Tax=Erythrobacter sp. SN021 TaxID=2912574 RepID=UPI001F2BD850|nr:aldehyde dehydrogenase family protein [Erythrobacter sp. SN021]MCF8883784.1 aldehyde dehydrogenase family protein [Erythrobacter sp. SN021]|tara:strand:+ start:673 stop:2091 length:1419 start_codon:yes stop_codon:yes gene_type:complete
MRNCTKFYIDGQWVDPVEENTQPVENPATEETIGHISFGTKADVDKAVAAARRAFESFSQTSKEERLTLLRAIQAEIENRKEELATAVSDEMGAPMSLASGPHVGLLAGHCQKAIEILEGFAFERQDGPTLHVWEPVGVVGMITPWNWPLNQIACKVFPALATGNTMVLKPSEIAPFNAYIFAEIMDAAGVPAGVFNLVNGDGPGVGEAISGHPDIDMVSFTGSTRAGILIAKNAADTVKRVAQELGGKSPNIVLDDSAFTQSVAKGTVAMMGNSGQTCTAPSRMLVPQGRMEEAKAAAKEAAEGVIPGDPKGNAAIGPVVSRTQWDKIQGLIEKGIEEGATLVAGGPGKPEGLETGHYVKPTVFADVDNDMTIAREEIFGPVLCILGYEDYDDAIRIANDTEYGLASAITGEDLETARKLAKRIRAGRVAINGGYDLNAAFGGYKKSGNGREWGEWGFHDFLEVKAVMGHG